MDNLNTHKAGSLYEAFTPEEAKAIWDKFEFVFTPKHGSWLNMAEIELGVLSRQCLDGRIPDKETLINEAAAWEATRNESKATVNWQFTTDDARIKLRKLYPSYDTWQSTSCHGANLEGEENWQDRDPTGLIKAPPHDDTGHTWHHVDAYLFDSVKQGGARLSADVGISPMPAYENVLTDTEIAASLAYIKSTWPIDIQATQGSR